jgi:hypothetical protein
LVDFTYMSRAGCLRLYEAGHIYVLSRAVAHAATKRELVAKQRPSHWMPPSMFRPPEVLTEAEVIEAEAELRPRSKPEPRYLYSSFPPWPI